MFIYTEAIRQSVFVWDYNIDEHYRIGAADDCHEVIDYLMHYNGMESRDISQHIGVRYTRPKDGQTLLSIDTFLAILNHFHCALRFTTTPTWQG